jgi:hypothetical protein
VTELEVLQTAVPHRVTSRMQPGEGVEALKTKMTMKATVAALRTNRV